MPLVMDSEISRLANLHGYLTSGNLVVRMSFPQPKLRVPQEEMQQPHQDMAESFGNQPDRVVREAREREREFGRSTSGVSAQSAITFSKERNLEREAVVEERGILRDALRRSMGDATLTDVRSEFEKRVRAGEFISVQKTTGAARPAFTTQEMTTCPGQIPDAPRSRERPSAPERKPTLGGRTNCSRDQVTVRCSTANAMISLVCYQRV